MDLSTHPRHSRGAVLRRVSVTVLLAAALPVAFPSGRASAAPASSPSCTSGVGYGGNTGPNPNSTGANGCVVIKYGAQFETFNYTGSNQTWTVPAGVTSVEFELLGAGGGKGNAVGGGGGYARGTYAVNPGDTFTIIVGQGGKNQSPTESAAFASATARRNASFGGGASGQGLSSYPNTWASGGGRSAIRLSGSTDDLATAGGGGGGGYTYGGGAGGGTTGLKCGLGVCGGGGTQSAGGAGGTPETGTAGIQYAGGYAGTLAGTGNQQSEGGGGGGGYYGGGGAGDNGGGGGGSSYVALLTGGTTVAGNGRVPGVLAPVNSTVPTVSGYAAVSATLTATGGTWTSTGTQSWKWQYSTDGVTYTDIPGETSTTTTATTAGYYRVVETQWNMLGTTSAMSAALRVQDAVVTSCTPTAGVFTHCRRFNFYGAPQSFTMPSYMTLGQTFQIEAWGGGGGGVCCNYWSADLGGGAGGYVKTKVTVTTLSETFNIEVGERGQPADTTVNYGGGGAGGASTNTTAHGASGGGFSGVFSGSGRTTPVVVVGGGGGASRGIANSNFSAGGGGSVGSGGAGANAAGTGRGGTTSAGGARATDTVKCDIAATDGSQYQGGRGCGSATLGIEAGGGGGGGYYGGGGGASNDTSTNGGGGGGSGYLDTSRATSLTATVGGQGSNSPLSGGRTSDQYVAGIASGGQGYVGTTAGATGGHGMIVFQWAEPPTARPDSKSGAVATAISLTPASNDTATAGTTLNVSSIKLCGSGETAPNCTKTSVSVSGEGAYSVSSGTVTFTGAAAFVGTSTLTYVIADGRGATASSTVAFTTLAPPTLRTDQVAGAKDEVLTASPLANDSASGTATLDTSTLKLCGVSPVQTAPNCTQTTITIAGEGTYALSGSNVTFTPVGPGYAYTGTRTLTYVVADSNAQTSSSTIAFIALPPPATRAVADSSTTAFDTNKVFSPLVNDSPGTAPSAYTTQGTVAFDTSTLNLCANSESQTNGSTTGCSQSTITVSGEGTWTLNRATSQVTFDPLVTFTGTATPVRYAVCNSITGTWAPSTPAVSCAGSTITVTVNAPTAPVASADSGSASYASNVSISPLSNDSGSGLSASRMYLCSPTETAPSCLSTTFTVAGEGTWTLNQSTGVVTFVPLPSFSGNATAINYVATDVVGQAFTQSVSASITAPTAPTGTTDVVTGTNDGLLTLTPLANDTGTGLTPGQMFLCGGSDVAPTCTQTSVTVTGKGVWTLDQATGVVTFDPEPNFVGTVGPLTYSVLDVVGQRATSTMTAVSSAPAAPNVPDLNTASDSGASSTDDVTNDSTPTIDVVGVTAGFTVTVTATKGATTVTCTFVASPTVSSCDLSTMADGVWNVTSRSTSPAGINSQVSAVLPVTIDTTVPTTPPAPDLAAASDTGTSSTDNYTGDTTPTISVPGQTSGDTINVTATKGGSTATCSFVADPNLASCDLPALADGTWNMTATATDPAGNVSATGPALAVQIDSAAPPAPGGPDLAASSDTGSSSTDNLTADNTPRIDVPGVTAGLTVTVVATRNGVSVSCTFVASATVSSCDMPLLVDGVWSVSAVVTNNIGNVSPAGPVLSITVDTAAPAAAAPDLAAESDTGSSSTDNKTSDNTPLINGTVGSAGDTVTITATKGSTTVTCSYLVGAATGCSLPVLADGDWSVTQSVMDTAGNVSPAGPALVVTVDTAAPAAAAPDLAAESDTGSLSTDNKTSDNTPLINGTVGSAGETVTITATKGSTTVTCSYVVGAATGCSLPVLADGDWSVTQSVMDAAGNVSPAGPALSITVDTAAPAAAAPVAPPDLATSSDKGASSSDNKTTDRTPTINGTVGNVGETVTISATKGGVTVSCSYTVGKATGCTLPALGDGDWSVTQTVTDTAGKTTTVGEPLALTIEPVAESNPPAEDRPNSRIANDTSGMARVVKGTAAVAGMPLNGWVKVERSTTEFVLTTSEGLKVAISARKTVDSAVKFNSRGMPVFYKGDVFRIAGEGLKPSSLASTWLYSSPVKLGELTVAADGSFGDEYPMGDGVPVGDHTAKLNAIAPDGTLRVVEVAVEIIDDTATPVVDSGAGNGAGGDAPPPIEQPQQKTVAILAGALALLAVKRKKTAAPVRDTGYGSREDIEGVDRLRMPRVERVDGLMRAASESLDRSSPMLARAINDGAYLRTLLGALWMLLPVGGAVAGILSALQPGHAAGIPSLALVITIVVLGCLDAFAGIAFTATYAAALVLSGGLSSVASVRGFLGITVFAFAPALIASATRPFRRPAEGEGTGWNRLKDFVLAPLFGAWAAGTMYSAIPVLSSRTTPHDGRIDLVQGIALIVLVVRWLLENSVPHLAPNRHLVVNVDEFEEPSSAQRLMSDIARTILFAFVAASFIGTNWALWLGTAFFLLPKMVDTASEGFPNVRALHRFLPRDLTRVVLLLFVLTWWAGLVADHAGGSADLVLYQFAFMCIPGLLLGAADWFGRESNGWRSTPVSKLAGTAVLVVGILVVRGFLL